MTKLDASFWNNRWVEGQTQWDASAITTPLKTYIDQLEVDSKLKILVPGAGSGWEYAYLREKGFDSSYMLDISNHCVDRSKSLFPAYQDQIYCGDFFEQQEQYDLIIEQTFFCALPPEMRPAYAKQMHKLLKKGGKLVGLLFQFPLEDGPPFGGSKEEYLAYFEPYFNIKVMEDCHNSIKPRSGRELFIILEKKA